MIVRISGKDIHLSEDLYTSVMRDLDPCLDALNRRSCDPLIIDVGLERQDPATGDVDTDPTYRTDVSIAAADQRISAETTSDSVRAAVKRAARRLAKKVEAAYAPRAKGTAREPRPSGEHRSGTPGTDLRAAVREPPCIVVTGWPGAG